MIVRKVLIVGDSISSHRPSVEKLGWSGSWGMAASTQDNDYVHLFLSRLTNLQRGTPPKLMIAGGGGGKLADKLTQLEKLKAFAADVAVIQLGENDNKHVTPLGFQKPYEDIACAILAGNPTVRLFCFSVWAPPQGSPLKDTMIREVCQKTGATFVNIDRVIADPECKAEAEKRFWHSGVNWHPGDKGMRGYADALWQAYTNQPFLAETTPSPIRERTKVLAVHDWGRLKKGFTAKTDALIGENRYETEIPAEQVRGQKLLVKTKIQDDFISATEKQNLNLHISLELEDAEAQITREAGRIEFRTPHVKWSHRMPDNLIRAKLVLEPINMPDTAVLGPLIIAISGKR